MRNRRDVRQVFGMLAALIISLTCSVILLCLLWQYKEVLDIVHGVEWNEDKIREFGICEEVLGYYLDGKNKAEDMIEEITLQMMVNDFELKDMSQIKTHILTNRCKKKLKSNPDFNELYSFYKTMLTKIDYFPVPNDLVGKQTVGFDNSWGGKRTYGGERKHEGCDIMTSNNERGYFPILSITDGVVENKGWLKLGGYRLGIRGTNGCYYYYAHLYSYADGVEEGDHIKAGQLLGFMGDTGYSEKEGTTGNFDVHLHMGMYVTLKGKEVSVNPYFILKYLEQKKVSYNF